jgi:hypothetical protein
VRIRSAVVTAAAAALTLPLVAQAAAPTDPVALARLTAAKLGTTLVATPEPLTSPNVDLVATIPGTYIGMHQVSTTRLVATGTDGLTTFDISDPALPKPMGVLPLPHFENEDVAADSRVAIVGNDREKGSNGGILFIVDLANMNVPTLASTLPLNIAGPMDTERGPGHTTNCVAPGANPCRTLWLTGGHRVWVADLSDLKAPKLLGAFDSPASMGSTGFGTPGTMRTGATHDVERDSTGTLWVTGSGGAFGYRLTADPLKPRLLTGTGKEGVKPDVNDFILHNSKRSTATKDTLLVTEEDYVDDRHTDDYPPGSCNGQGKFQTWSIAGGEQGRGMKLLDQWKTEVTGAPFVSGNKAPITANCSSHWFQERKGVAAVGWYEQGTRLLDVRNPKAVKQVGYWLPPNAVTWAAYWITDDIVYTADVGRGIDVLRVNRAATKPTVAPIRAEWLGAAPRTELLAASKAWGWGCATMLEHA